MKVLVASLMYVSEVRIWTLSRAQEYPCPQRSAVQALGTLLPLSWVIQAHPPPMLPEAPLLTWQAGVRGQGLTPCHLTEPLEARAVPV